MMLETSKYQIVDGNRSGIAAIVGAMLVLSLFAIGVTLHPGSVKGPGASLLGMDVALVLLIGGVGVWVARQRIPKVNTSLKVGAIVGLVLGAANVAHHVAEFFVPPLGRGAALALLGAGHMLLIFALFCVAGSAARERTDSIGLAMVAGVWSAMLSAPILIAFGLASNLLFESATLVCELIGTRLPSTIRHDGTPVGRRVTHGRPFSLVRAAPRRVRGARPANGCERRRPRGSPL